MVEEAVKQGQAGYEQLSLSWSNELSDGGVSSFIGPDGTSLADSEEYHTVSTCSDGHLAEHKPGSPCEGCQIWVRIFPEVLGVEAGKGGAWRDVRL